MPEARSHALAAARRAGSAPAREACIAAALAIVVALPFVGPARGVFGDDDLEYAVPFARHVLRELSAGRAPTWNPATDGGLPLLAQQPWMGPCYPGLALFAALPDGVALAAGYALHAALYAVGTYLLLRRLGLLVAGALLGGLLAGLGSDVAVAWNRGYLHHLVSVAWLPWPILAFETARTSGRPVRCVAAGALAVGASFLGGHTVSAMQMLLALGLWCSGAVVATAWGGDLRAAARAAGIAVGIAAGGLTLAAVQLEPIAGAAAASPALADGRAFKPWDAEMAAPWRRVGYWLPRWEVGLKGRDYVGLVPVLLAPLGLLSIDRRGRHQRDVGAAALAARVGSASVTGAARAAAPLGMGMLCAALACGPHTPVLAAAAALLPPLAVVSYGYFFAPPVHLALAWLAAVALHRLVADGAPPRRLLGVGVGTIALAASVVAACASRVGADPLDPRGLAASVVPATSVVVPFLGILLLAASGRVTPRRAAAACVALAALDLGAYRLAARREKPRYETATYFRAQDPIVAAVVARASLGRVFHVEATRPVSDWRLRRNGGLVLGYEEIRRSARAGFEPYQRHLAVLPDRWLDWEEALRRDDAGERQREPLLLDEAAIAALDRLAVATLVSDLPLAGAGASAYVPVTAASDVVVYAREPVPARAHLEPRAEPAAAAVAATPPVGPAGPALGRIQSRERVPGRIVLDVDAAAPVWLEVSELRHPRTQVTIDGRAVAPDASAASQSPFVRAPVDRGVHRVVVQQRSSRAAAGASVTSAVVLLAALLGGARGGSRRTARAAASAEGGLP